VKKPLPPYLRRRWIRALAAAGLLWLALCLAVPSTLFRTPCATLLYSQEGELLGARIAPDGQWRFPPVDSLPQRFADCLITYEDRRFFYHPGIDPAALLRALRTNLSAGRTLSGGSTLTMQLARLARGNRPRNLYQKGVEALWAAVLETRYTKHELLNLYASHAPFGGNVVGLETAAWRYFGREAASLSWAESAMLAVLPNAPALIHPGRNRTRLKEKRDRLLHSLRSRGVIDQTTCELACMEPLPEAPLPLPDRAPHLMTRIAGERPGRRITVSLDASLQERTQETVNRYARTYASNHVYNLAALIANVETGETLAYAGNVSFRADERYGNQVDVITSPRSTGSILKPFLYAGMLHDGRLLPNTLLSDVPLHIDGFAPQNYSKTFRGAVPAGQAIEQSLNVPLVRMLMQYNTGRFMTLLKQWGVTTLRFPESHYGASLILGGAEATLWDLAGMYASAARVLGHYRSFSGRYLPADIHPLSLFPSAETNPVQSPADRRLTDRPALSAASLWFTFKAMSAPNRPEEEAEWLQFASMKQIAWKTGTSYGGRDAWAIGLTPRHVVAVWVGNASGEGRPGLTGAGYAAPVLFDLFSLLPGGDWFDIPYDEMEEAAVCRDSGHLATEICTSTDTIYIPRSGRSTAPCPYHRLVHLSADGLFRVNSSCEPLEAIRSVSRFVLPPAQAYYYRNYHMDYVPLPPLKPGCEQGQSALLDILYPDHQAVLYLPRGFTGEYEQFIFRAAHTRPEAAIYWHIDDVYIGETSDNHQIACRVGAGHHLLTIVDTWGNQRRISFEVKPRISE
jgi:penicillin-binding protein 1C